MNEILSRLTKHTLHAIRRARVAAIRQKSAEIQNIHLFYAIAAEKGSAGQNILKEMGLNERLTKNASEKERVSLTKNVPFSKELKETFRQAAKIAARFNYPYIGTEHLIYAILKANDKQIESVLSRSLLEKTRKTNLANLPLFNSSGGGSDLLQSMNTLFQVKQKEKQEYSPLLRFANNLNLENEEEGVTPVIGRQRETERIISILMRKNKNNPVLVGEPGVGKTAIVNALAQRINRGEVPQPIAEKSIYELDLGLLLAGTTFRGEFEQRMKEIIDQAESDENVILFIDEIHNLIGAGSVQGSLDAANMLKPALAKGDLRLIGATTFEEYRRYIEKDPALERRFQPITVKEPQEEETKKILMGIRKNYEAFHDVAIDGKAIEAAVTLSQRYISDRFLPDKAIDLIDEAQARARANAISFDMTKRIKRCLKQKKRIETMKQKLVIKNDFKAAADLKKNEQELDEILDVISREQERREGLTAIRITERDIKEIVSERTGIPIDEMDIYDSQQILNLKKKLSSRIVGQKEAVSAVTQTIQRATAGIHDPSRPLGSFIFLGPTGVGKTSLAKALAEVYFKNPTSFIRIDMSEFGEKHNVSRLVGAPAGYVGYEDGGKLTDKVRRNPYSLILFDEIEKAHPEVFNIFLQILEDGILTDAAGRTISFKNTIIIMTSNLGTKEFLGGSLGFEGDSPLSTEKPKEKTKAKERLKEMLLPELLNRIDKIVVFNPLSPKDLAFIAKKEIEKLKKRLKGKRVELIVSPKTYMLIAKKSENKREGARLVRKNIEDLIQVPVAEIVLGGRDRKIKTVEIKVIKDSLGIKEI